MKYLAYLNILFGDKHVQNSGNCKKEVCPEDNLGIKNQIKKIMSINFNKKYRTEE